MRSFASACKPQPHTLRCRIAPGSQATATLLAKVRAGACIYAAPAKFLAQADGVLAGQALADMVLAQVDPSLKVRSPLRCSRAAGR